MPKPRPARSSVAVLSSGVPKIIPSRVKLRIAALLGEGRTAVAVAELVSAEFPEHPVSRTTVGKIAKALSVELPVGRPLGTGCPGARFSPNRDKARELRSKGLTLVAIAAELGITKQAVSYLLSADD